MRVISLRSNRSRQRTAWVFTSIDEIDNVCKIVSRLPAKVSPCPFVDVDAIDAGEHRPNSAGIHIFIARHQPFHDRRCIGPEFMQIVACERCCRADNVAAEPYRSRSFESLEVSAHDVLDVGPRYKNSLALALASE